MKAERCSFIETERGEILTEWLTDEGYVYANAKNGLWLKEKGLSKYKRNSRGKILGTRILTPYEVLAL